MKRLRLTLLLLMLMMMLTACATSGNSMEALSVTAAPQEDEIPRADGDDAAATDTSALIWYRYGDDPHSGNLGDYLKSSSAFRNLILAVTKPPELSF